MPTDEIAAHPPRSRPFWATPLAIFCLATLAFLIPRDLFVAHVRDVEVWFGFEVRGAAARWTAPLHWAVFAVGAWAFWTDRRWATPAAAVYAFYVALSHWVWSGVSPAGAGWAMGFAYFVVFSLPGFALLALHRARR